MLKKILARIIKWLRLITFSTLEILLFAFCWTMMMINLGEIHQSKYFFILNYRKLILKANKKIYENDNLSSFIKRFISIYYRSSEAVVYERFIFIFLFFSPLANNFYIFYFLWVRAFWCGRAKFFSFPLNFFNILLLKISISWCIKRWRRKIAISSKFIAQNSNKKIKLLLLFHQQARDNKKEYYLIFHSLKWVFSWIFKNNFSIIDAQHDGMIKWLLWDPI